MPRKRTRKTDFGQTDDCVMRQAVRAVLVEHKAERAVAREFDVKRSTLQRYIKKCKDVDWKQDPEGKNVLFRPNYACRQIFSDEEEKQLSEYLSHASKLHHGLPPKECRKLAYEYAIRLKKNVPQSWSENKCAGEDWLEGFMKRVGNISLRKPEATSLARSMGFNKPVVLKFYDKLAELLENYKFGPENIYNLDESGVTTVQTPGKIIAAKGSKQVGQVTSGERGELVTLCCTINAVGNSIPPFFIFPRVKFVETMLFGAPIGSKGAATVSGWMNSDVFLKVLEHFIHHSKSSIENKTLLLMDNHESHISIEAITLAKTNGIILYTLPPHCSHKLQPLDKTVFGPLKRYFNEACRSWLVNHPGKRITIHQIAELVGTAYPNAFSINNITSGFKSTGIFPLNSNIYSDADFTAAIVTDVDLQPEVTNLSIPLHSNGEDVQPSCSSSSHQHESDDSTLKPITPEAVRPFPKVSQLQTVTKKRGRKVRTSEVLTDTPIKARIEKEAAERMKVKNKKQKRETSNKHKKQESKMTKKLKEKVSRCLYEETSSDEEEWHESDSNNDLQLEEITDEDDFNIQSISVGDFVLVKFCGKSANANNSKYYTAEVVGKTIGGLEIKYLKRNLPGYNFIFEKDEVYLALEEDIERKLPKPITVGGTERTLTQLSFPVNFESYGNRLF